MSSSAMVPVPEPEKKRFDLAKYRKSTAQVATVARAITSIPVRGPQKDEFVRTHPDPAMHYLTSLTEERKQFSSILYLVAEDLQAELKIDLTDRLLVPTVSSVGAFFLWPVNVSERNGEKTRWAVTAQEAVDTAMTQWTRVIANADEGGYTTFVAQADLGEPTFPDFDLETIMDKAFKDRVIDTLNHPRVEVLRGLRKK
jgi:hypothetical protein